MAYDNTMRKASGLLHVTEYIPMRHFAPKPIAVAPSVAMQAPPDLPMGKGKGKTAGALQGKLDAVSGILDMSTVDTTPGARCAMAPPAGLDLDPDGYRDLMRKRYRDDPGHRQHMVLYAKRKAPCSGPYAEQAAAILSAIRGDK